MKLSEVLKSEVLTCAIPYADIKTILDSIGESAADGKERAITFCGNGQELSFPKEVGWPFAVAPPECPSGKERIGDFHTHIPEEGDELYPPEKSISDWEMDMRQHRIVSCVGGPQLALEPEGVIRQRTVICHRFDREHTEYDNFRERFVTVSSEASDYFTDLNFFMEEEDRLPTDEECDKWEEHEIKVKTLLEEGMSKGIIRSCAPFSMPDVEGMLEEQK